MSWYFPEMTGSGLLELLGLALLPALAAALPHLPLTHPGQRTAILAAPPDSQDSAGAGEIPPEAAARGGIEGMPG